MKTPELSILYSETIAAELAFGQLALMASGDDLAALTDRLGLQAPDALSAALVYPGDHALFPNAKDTEDPAKADVASVGMQDLSVLQEEILPVTIGELSEQDILKSFARSLMAQGQFNKRMRVLKWGAITLMAEIGIGSTVSAVQGPGFNYGLLGVPLAGITIGGLWLWQRGWHNKPPVVPNLDGLESPVRILRQIDAP